MKIEIGTRNANTFSYTQQKYDVQCAMVKPVSPNSSQSFIFWYIS